MTYSYNAAIFGALFHDIGKFIQKTENDLRIEFQGSEECCPVKNNHPTHVHVKYTDGFFTKINSQQIVREFDLKNIYDASWHHQPSDDSPLQWIIAKGDWYSSGCDRSKNELNEELNYKNYFKFPLISILSEIKLKKPNTNAKIKYRLKPFKPENLIECISHDKLEHSQKEYSEYFKFFYNDFLELNSKILKFSPQERNFLNYCRLLNSLLQNYLWCIPSTVKDYPDISLYDHSIVTAAISACLFKFHEADNSLDDITKIKDDTEEKFIFLSGDLSGIQKYIFNIKKSKYSAKSLRARSFEVQVLSENISNYILNKFNLPVFNKILNAGGRFLLLLPNTQQVKEELSTIKGEIEEKFLYNYFGELTLNISDLVYAKGEDFNINKMPELYAKIQKAIEIAKLKKLQRVLTSPEKHVIEKYYDKFKSNQDLCPICEKMPKEENGELCKKCNLITVVGSKLPKSKYLKWKNSIIEFPEILQSDEIEQDKIYGIFNEFKNGFESYYSPYYVPKNEENEILTFEDIALKNEGAKYLAMFKADVDNLGLIFSAGLGEKRSISRISTLSNLLNAFFTGFLNYFISNNFKELYVVFSGGDDVCLIGPWEEIIEFSLNFYKKFKIFTGNNDNLTISAGIFLFHHNFPVKNASKFAENSLEKSKTGEKNSITLFDCKVSWDEFSESIEKGKELDKWIKEKKISRGMVYRLLKYSRMAKSTQKGEFKNAIWRSHFYYDTVRNIKDKGFREIFLQKMEKLLFENYAEISINYAIYKNRED